MIDQVVFWTFCCPTLHLATTLLLPPRFFLFEHWIHIWMSKTPRRDSTPTYLGILDDFENNISKWNFKYFKYFQNFLWGFLLIFCSPVLWFRWLFELRCLHWNTSNNFVLVGSRPKTIESLFRHKWKFFFFQKFHCISVYRSTAQRRWWWSLRCRIGWIFH